MDSTLRTLFLCLLVLGISVSSPAGPKLPLIEGGAHPSGHRHLAEPVGSLGSHYNYLVIGSGYGASTAALRLSEELCKKGGEEALGEVAVLERGKEWLPGDFPETLPEVASSVHGPRNPLGLIDTHTASRADMDVVGANGLGGTSLLNAAITARPRDYVWDLPRWPVEIRNDFRSGALEADFQRAEGMLKPNLGPKTASMPKSAAHLKNFPKGFPTGQLTLNINHEPQRQQHGVTQKACTSCGNCCGGCNVGAKNTLTTNYLPKAKDNGARIFTEIEVQSIQQLPPGGPRYRVNYVTHRKNSFGFYEKTEGSVTANNVFLGAGSAGTTEILLRSKALGLSVSEKLGENVSANGDVLGFVYNGTHQTNVAGHANTKSPVEVPNPVGQMITVFGDYSKSNSDGPIENRFLLLDGAIPSAMVPAASTSMAALGGAKSLTSFSAAKRVAKDAGRTVPPQDGAINHSMVLLACGHDSCGGRYVLGDNGRVHVVWPNMQDEASFKYIHAEMEAYAKRMGGTFIPNPRSSFAGGGKMQATHPLGGAIMGESAASGVVNHLGQVFDGKGGLHQGFYVVDAAVIPHSLAAPPLVTLTALAERSMRNFVSLEFPAPCNLGEVLHQLKKR